jgi:hypothetical protein
LRTAAQSLEARYWLGLTNVAEEDSEAELVKNRCGLVLAGVSFGVASR